MYLHQDKNWESVRLGDKTILPKDVKLFPAVTWHELLYHIEVEPINGTHRYRQVSE